MRRIIAGVAVIATACATSSSPVIQYRSMAGVEFGALPDTGPVARAESALATDPRNVERILDLGLAQAGARRYREAIRTFTRGMEIAPSDVRFYRWRGHRYLSTGDMERAMRDLTRGFEIDTMNYGVLYHLGIVRFAREDFSGAADAFARAQARAPDGGELAGATDWLWMALSRSGRGAEAKAMLDRRPDSLATTNTYRQRLRLYRGELGPDEVLTPGDTNAIGIATLSYGVGNWYLVREDTVRAIEWFERAVSSGGWPGFGFLLSEIELRRLR